MGRGSRAEKEGGPAGAGDAEGTPPRAAAPTESLPDSAAWSLELHAEALARKGADGACPACGRSDWTTAPSTVLLQAIESDGHFVPGRGLDAVVVFCRHCGLLRLHAAPVLIRD